MFSLLARSAVVRGAVLAKPPTASLVPLVLQSAAMRSFTEAGAAPAPTPNKSEGPTPKKPVDRSRASGNFSSQQRILEELGSFTRSTQLKTHVEGLFREDKATPQDLYKALTNCRYPDLFTSVPARSYLAEHFLNLALEKKEFIFSPEIFNQLINVYVETRKDFSVAQLVKVMASRRVSPSITTHQLLMQAYAQQGDVRGVRESMDHIRNLNPKRVDETLYWPLLDAHMEIGDLLAVRAVLEEMKAASINIGLPTYSHLLFLCGKHGFQDFALEILETAKSKKLKLQLESYDDIIFALVQHGQMEEVAQVFQMQENAGARFAWRPQFEFMSAAVLGDFDAAAKALKKHSLSRPRQETLEALFRGFAARADIINLLRLRQYCVDNRVPVMIENELCLLQACELAGNPLVAEQHLKTMLNDNRFHDRRPFLLALRSLARSNCPTAEVVQRTIAIKEGMNLANLRIQRDYWNTLLHVWSTPGSGRPVSREHFDRALSRMTVADYTPQTWHSLLSLRAHDESNPNALAEMEQIVTNMLAAGEHLTQKTYRILLNAYAVRGNMQGVANVISQIKSDPNCNAADATLYTPIIEHYARRGDFDSAIAVLDNIQPVASNLYPLFNACVTTGDVDTALRLMQVLRKLNLDPDHRVYARLFEIYSKSKDFSGMLTLLRNAKPEVIVGSTSHVVLQGAVFENDPVKLKALVTAMKEKGLHLSASSVNKFLTARKFQGKGEKNIDDIFSPYASASTIGEHVAIRRAVSNKDAPLVAKLFTKTRPTLSNPKEEMRTIATDAAFTFPTASEQIKFMLQVQKEVPSEEDHSAEFLNALMRVYLAGTPVNLHSIALLLEAYPEGCPLPYKMLVPLVSDTLGSLLQKGSEDKNVDRDKSQQALLRMVKALGPGFTPRVSKLPESLFKIFEQQAPGATAAALLASAHTSSTTRLSSQLLRDLALVAMRKQKMEDMLVLLQEVREGSAEMDELVSMFTRTTGRLTDGLSVFYKINPAGPSATQRNKVLGSFLQAGGDVTQIVTALRQGVLVLNEDVHKLCVQQKESKNMLKAICGAVLRSLDTLALSPESLRHLTMFAARSNNADLAGKCVEQLRAAGQEPDSAITCELVCVAARTANLARVRELLQAASAAKVDFSEEEKKRMVIFLLYMGKPGFTVAEELLRSIPEKTAEVKNALMDFYAVQNQSADAIQVFESIIEQGLVLEADPLQNLVMSLARNGDAERAEQYMEEYLTRKPEPFRPTFAVTGLVKALVSANQLDRAIELFQKLEQRNVPMVAPTVGLLFSGLVAKGQAEQAVKLYDEACEKHAEWGCDFMRELLLKELIPKDFLEPALEVVKKSSEPLRHDTMLQMMRALVRVEDVAHAAELVGIVRSRMNPVPDDIQRVYALGTLRIAVRRGKGVDVVEGILDDLVKYRLATPITLGRMHQIWIKGGMDGNVLRMLTDLRKLRVDYGAREGGEENKASTEQG